MNEPSDAPTAVALCKNCSAEIDAKKVLRCGVCKKAAYCTATCQKEDWKYHKRVCKKPEDKDIYGAPAKPPMPDILNGTGEQQDTSMAEVKRQMDELTAGKDDAFKHQVHSMMAGMLGQEAPPPPPKAPEPPPQCQSCATPCEKPLRCGSCKTATYCSAKCQKDDWRFHKRICKKPEPAAAAPQGAEDDKTKEGASGAVPATSSSAPRPKDENEKVVVDDDVGSWYKHRDWKPSDERKDFTPAKVAAESAKASLASSGASAWNAAGTWEEKNMVPWWRDRLKGLKDFTGDGKANLKVDNVNDIAGEANIAYVRGQPKFMYDITCSLEFSGLQYCKPCEKSGDGSRCSNCVRYKGKLDVTDLSWACENDPSFRACHKVADGPDHVKKANSSELSAAAEAQLVPGVRTFLAESVAEYKTTVAGAADAKKWASQLPPTAAA